MTKVNGFRIALGVIILFLVLWLTISLNKNHDNNIKTADEQSSLNQQTSLNPTILLTKELTPTTSPEPTNIPTPTKVREIKKASTQKGLEFYEKVETLRKQGRVNGELCTEFESDPIVDVNPESPAVQLSLMYPSITGSVKSSDKSLILNDFKVIKALAEQDKSMILPEYGTLRLFVLTFHDSNCIAKGELQQLMIDYAPEWVDWKQ